jgi:hypothetical protein
MMQYIAIGIAIGWFTARPLIAWSDKWKKQIMGK